jgi:prevent-host-death family protein
MICNNILGCVSYHLIAKLRLCPPVKPLNSQYFTNLLLNMYSTRGIDTIATITELRSNTTELVDHASEIERGIMIQKNNEPYAVLISYDLYLQLLDEREAAQSAD